MIVLEDDLAVAPDFLDYMLQALDKYRDRSEVYQISGYMFPVVHSPKPDAFLLPLTTTWGWATWDRSWRIFDWNAPGSLLRLTDRELRRRFNLDSAYPYSEMLEQRLAGLNDSWGILWLWAVFQVSGLVLHPRATLVWNTGFDGSGTHCGASDDFQQMPATDMNLPILEKPLIFPEEVASDEAALVRIVAHLKTRFDKRNRSLWDRIWNRLMRQMSLQRTCSAPFFERTNKGQP